MEINQLKYFVEIAKLGSMSAAAEAMHITQQGISIAMRRLESEIGVELFYQKNKRLYLTDFGSEFYLYANKVVDAMSSLSNFVSAYTKDYRSEITVAIVLSRLTRTPPALQRLLLTPPDGFRVKIREAYSVECAEMVAQGSADFALVYGSYDDALFDQIILENLQRVFVVNRSNPLASKDIISIKDLDNIPLILTDKKTTSSGRDVYKMFEEAGVHLNLAYECNWHHQAIELASVNPNIAAACVLSDLSESDYNVVKPLQLDVPFTQKFTLLTKKGRKFNIHQQLFKRLMLECYTNKETEKSDAD